MPCLKMTSRLKIKVVKFFVWTISPPLERTFTQTDAACSCSYSWLLKASAGTFQQRILIIAPAMYSTNSHSSSRTGPSTSAEWCSGHLSRTRRFPKSGSWSSLLVSISWWKRTGLFLHSVRNWHFSTKSGTENKLHSLLICVLNTWLLQQKEVYSWH